jgi:Rap1a immunity proteins
MTNSGLLFGATLALIGTAAQAAEDTNSANDILPSCRAAIDRKSVDRLVEQSLCVGIVIGIVGTMDAVRGMLQLSQSKGVNSNTYVKAVCVDYPKGVTIEQMIRVVIAHIEARPARMHEDFRVLAIGALSAAWPCK